MNRGSRNLAILGLAIVIFALTSTTISLLMYHNSGDIYLDRSRPGFLPDKDESLKGEDSYVFPETGDLDREVLDEFLDHYKTELERLDSLGDPFSASVLSDEALGISEQ